MTTRKTFWGGLFLIIFLAWAILVAANAVNFYLHDNVFENKALVPYVVLYKDYKNIHSDIWVNVTFINYPGNCNQTKSSNCKRISIEI